MTKKYIFLFLSVIAISINNPAYEQNVSDTTSVKYLMSMGQDAYVNGDFEKSNYYYKKVLKDNKNNYDAKYGVAANYYRLKEYNNALEIYDTLYSQTPDNTDVINGMARCLIKLELYEKAMKYVRQSVTLNNKDISPYSDMAFLFIVKNKLDSARYAYNQIIKIDSLNAEAYAGIGKMYYWQDKPATALKYYQMASKLDPDDSEIKDKIETVRNELAYSISITLMDITEEESSYKIDALIQRYGIEKRINDYLHISLYTLWDNSSRDNLYYDDVKRWYDNTWIKPTFIFNSHRISLFAGASANDDKITSYGFTWNSTYNVKKIKIRNYLTAAYDYFYYWNKVGQNFYQNTLGITYKRISLWGTYRYANIKNNYVWDIVEKTDNPNTRYSLGLKYELFNNPKITIGLNQFNMDYKYASPLYYSPHNRTIRGCFISNYFKFKKIYTYEEFLYGMASDKVDQTSGSAELGYETGKLSFSLNGNYFKNEFYKSKNIFLSIKKTF